MSDSNTDRPKSHPGQPQAQTDTRQNACEVPFENAGDGCNRSGCLREAAPDLLEVLKETLAEIEHWHADLLTPEERVHPRGSGWARIYDKVLAAVAKAEGKAP